MDAGVLLAQALRHERFAFIAFFPGRLDVAGLHFFLLGFASVGEAGFHEGLAFITFLARGSGVAGFHDVLLLVGSKGRTGERGGKSGQDQELAHVNLQMKPDGGRISL